jgi:hypothetical protein
VLQGSLLTLSPSRQYEGDYITTPVVREPNQLPDAAGVYEGCMTPEAVEEFFARYAAAFSRGDAKEIGSFWKLPAFITGPERSVCFTDAAAFRANTDALCGFYRARGMARAHKTVLRIDPAGERVAMVTTGDDLLDAEGRIIARWKHVYLLRETADGLRAIAAVGDDEISAWTAKGTPLGR